MSLCVFILKDPNLDIIYTMAKPDNSSELLQNTYNLLSSKEFNLIRFV